MKKYSQKTSANFSGVVYVCWWRVPLRGGGGHGGGAGRAKQSIRPASRSACPAHPPCYASPTLQAYSHSGIYLRRYADLPLRCISRRIKRNTCCANISPTAPRSLQRRLSSATAPAQVTGPSAERLRSTPATPAYALSLPYATPATALPVECAYGLVMCL